VLRIVISPLPLILFSGTAFYNPVSINTIFDRTDFSDSIIVIGSIGQLLLNFRYLYQWYFSEKANESLLPLGFWIISAIASVMVVYYGFNRLDPVLLVAQSMGFIAYCRNIYLLIRQPARQA